MTKKAAVITAASVGAAAALLLAPQSGNKTRRTLGRGVSSCLHDFTRNVRNGGRAVGHASRRVGGTLTGFVRRG